MRVTIVDVAKQAGVSKSTVSNVLNGHFQRVSGETRERVYAAIRDLNYRPNQVARSLVRRRSDVIGVLVANINRDPYPAAVRGIDDTLSELGWNILLSSHDYQPEREGVLLRVLADRQVDGLIVVSQSGRPISDHAIQLAMKGLPVVYVNPLSTGTGPVSAIRIDNHSGAYASTKHLIALGHRDIACLRAYVTGPFATRSAIERYEGYQRALYESGIALNPSRVYEGSYAKDGGWQSGYNVGKRLLEQERLPSAIVCANDFLAHGAMTALQEAGVRIPSDIAIIGHDDTALGRYSSPRLTTVEQPMYQAGVTAANILRAALDGDDEVKTVTLPCQLVVQQSCGGKMVGAELGRTAKQLETEKARETS